MYMPSSKYKEGDPMGFQRWIKAHKTSGIMNKNTHLVGFLVKRVTVYRSRLLKPIEYSFLKFALSISSMDIKIRII